DRHAKDPGLQLAGAVEAMELAEHPQEDLLRRVGGIGFAPQHPQGEVVDRALPCEDDPLEVAGVLVRLHVRFTRQYTCRGRNAGGFLGAGPDGSQRNGKIRMRHLVSSMTTSAPAPKWDSTCRRAGMRRGARLLGRTS